MSVTPVTTGLYGFNMRGRFSRRTSQATAETHKHKTKD